MAFHHFVCKIFPIIFNTILICIIFNFLISSWLTKVAVVKSGVNIFKHFKECALDFFNNLNQWNQNKWLLFVLFFLFNFIFCLICHIIVYLYFNFWSHRFRKILAYNISRTRLMKCIFSLHRAPLSCYIVAILLGNNLILYEDASLSNYKISLIQFTFFLLQQSFCFL